MRFPVIAVLPLAAGAAVAAVLAAHAAVPDWTNSTDRPGWAGGTPPKVEQMPQLSCAVQDTATALTFTLKDVSVLPTPAGLSAITLCNMQQPNGPPLPPNTCGGMGQIQVPALKPGGTYSWSSASPYVSTRTPTCTAGDVQAQTIN
jgi:hypothetical protein